MFSRSYNLGRSSARASSQRTGLSQCRRLMHSEASAAMRRSPFVLGTAVAAAAFLVGSATAVATIKSQSSEINCEGGSSWFNIFGGGEDGRIRRQMEAHVRKTQNDIVHAIEELEGPSGGRFKRDSWIRKEGGEGLTCVLQDGKVFQKAGVAVSVIHSIAPDGMLTQMRAKKNPNLGKGPFKMFVGGISLVMHPHNPNAPTVHMNYRYFELYPVDGSSKKPVLWWFGGGSDLTPSYLFEEDAEHFHKTIKDVCDKHDPEYYPKFKKWCDGYFNNTHRGDERRGIGGIFFDDLDDREPEKLFEFVKDASQAFLKQYIPIMEKRKDMPFTEEMTRWQQIRRGRYVEFNLVHDRGTKFGLATPSARIESIFLSLPLTARWEYMHAPLPGSEEFKLLEVLRKPRDWA